MKARAAKGPPRTRLHTTDDIAVNGTVQDVGFRDLVETLGRTHGLRGFVDNEGGGTVRIVARGPADDVAAFIAGVRESSERAGILVREIVAEETDEPEPLPATFFRAPTHEWSDIGRKLDEGIQVLRDFMDGTAAITDETT